MNVFVTGCGRKMALGFNFVRRYLEQGDNVIATVRKPCADLDELKKQYPETLHVLEMDIGSTPSVEAAAKAAAGIMPCIDLLINNAVTTSKDCSKELMDCDLDLIAKVIDVDAVGPLRVTRALFPLLKKSSMTALVVNISSEAGSIGKCYRTNMVDYGMAKAALNMATMLFHNVLKDDKDVNIFCIHPGWMRTNNDNLKAPFDPYDSAEIMRKLFEKKRNDKDGDVFITYEGEKYPF